MYALHNQKTSAGARRQQLRRILSLFRPYAFQELLALVGILGGALLGLLPPLLTIRIIDSLPSAPWSSWDWPLAYFR